MADFRKRCINFEEAGNIVDKRHAPDPPGYDLVAARESVRLQFCVFPSSSARLPASAAFLLRNTFKPYEWCCSHLANSETSKMFRTLFPLMEARMCLSALGFLEAMQLVGRIQMCAQGDNDDGIGCIDVSILANNSVINGRSTLVGFVQHHWHCIEDCAKRFCGVCNIQKLHLHREQSHEHSSVDKACCTRKLLANRQPDTISTISLSDVHLSEEEYHWSEDLSTGQGAVRQQVSPLMQCLQP